MACTRGSATKTIVLSPAEPVLTPRGTTKEFSSRISAVDLTTLPDAPIFPFSSFWFQLCDCACAPDLFIVVDFSCRRDCWVPVVPKWMTWKSKNYNNNLRAQIRTPAAKGSVGAVHSLFVRNGSDETVQKLKNSKQWKYQRRRVK